MTHDNVTDIVERLQDVCLDWDGSQMKDAEEPRNWLSVGEIREAASTIATLRKQLKNARSEALEEAEFVVIRDVNMNAQARRDRADNALAFEFEGIGKVILRSIRALKGQPC